ncbi:MAG: 50S ribosomal protein L24 [Candidatus Gribaldobacteria bacterium]|nr:50S ribosomal protein L24 [Candidatus Gribaldobacteria bacterium]
MKIKKGDNVIVISGKDKGKKGKVQRGFPALGLLVIEKVNLKKVHKKPRKQGEKGQVVEVAAPIKACKVMLICGKCAKVTRTGYKIENDKKIRICKKCQESI